MSITKVIEFSITTPGKVILHGEHSVVYGKTALAASVDLKTVLKFTTRLEKSEPTIVLDFPTLGYKQEILIKDLWKLFITDTIPLLRAKPQCTFCLNTPENIDFDNLLAKAQSFIQVQELTLTRSQEYALLSFLCLFWGMFSSVDVTIPSCYIRVTSELEIRAGMGSSTAYNICLAAAFLQFIRRAKLCQNAEVCEISKENYKSFKYWSTDLEKFEKDELDLISRWGHVGDKIMHGNPSGIDNAVCTYGSVIEFKKGEHGPDIKIIPDPKFLKILLVNSKVPRSTKKLVSSVAARRKCFASVVEPILQAMDSIALTAAEVLRRMSQVSKDDSCSAVEKTLNEEIGKLQELVDINQKLLEALGVSHDSLEHICRIAKMEGLHGKLTGAGGGGYAFVLLPFIDNEEQLCTVKMSFERHFFPVQQVTLGGPGVTLNETHWSYSSTGEGKSGEPTVDLPDVHASLQLSSDVTSSSQVIPTQQYEQDKDEEEMEEWPWPFDLKEVVKSMFRNQIHKDLQYDEISIPLRNLCAVNVPDTLPQWMQNLTNFQEQISPVWKNVLQEGQLQDKKSGEERKKIKKESNGDPKIKNEDFIHEIVRSSLMDKRISGKSTSIMPRAVSRTGDRKQTMSKHGSTPDSNQTNSIGGSRRIVNEDYHIPKQASYRETLFGQLHHPAKWLKDQFPPYGGRQWSSDSHVEESAKRQVGKLLCKHKKFLKNLKAGCENKRKEQLKVDAV